ncbi:RXT2-like protein [Bisporella sp. PMI_857]|nr:RXT2-like protein [Bisporella sp. PMI_857]
MSQAVIFAETIAGMKRAVKRREYDSDSDSSIEHLTNRGNKLKRKARYVRQGQLAPPTGPPTYKRKIKHAGYEREIISRNPPIVDEDGYEVDSDDDDETAQDAVAAAAEFDPYADVKIEYLLAPLTSAADLPNHPTLSKPFLSKTLTELTKQAGEMVHKEKASLWKIKHLLTKLSGDDTWIPCETVEAGDDFLHFEDEREKGDNVLSKITVKDDGDHASVGTLISEDPGQLLVADPAQTIDSISRATNAEVEMAMNEPAGVPAEKNSETMNAERPSIDATGEQNHSISEEISNGVSKVDGNELMDVDTASPGVVESGNNINKDVIDSVNAGDVEEGDQGDAPAPHRMRTRAQAQAATDTATSRTRSATPDSSMESFVHPYFLAPASSHPDRDLGLPQQEVEDVRRILQLYIQKQEEVCRGAERLYEGLLKAERYRKTVMKWAKAEAHVGVNRDMSDGEDWYDKEEWGLDEDLKKGENEEEEDPQTVAKKTRARRQ